MPFSVEMLKNTALAAKELGLAQIPDQWLTHIQNGWTLKLAVVNCNSYGGKHSFISSLGELINGRWSWFTPKGEFYGCVCHSIPNEDLTTVVDSWIFDQGGWSYCRHCGTTVDLNQSTGICVSCHRSLTSAGSEVHVDSGGSDFD